MSKNHQTSPTEQFNTIRSLFDVCKESSSRVVHAFLPISIQVVSTNGTTPLTEVRQCAPDCPAMMFQLYIYTDRQNTIRLLKGESHLFFPGMERPIKAQLLDISFQIEPVVCCSTCCFSHRIWTRPQQSQRYFVCIS